MWKSKRRKYLEALLEGIRDRQHDLIYKTQDLIYKTDKSVEENTQALREGLLEQQNQIKKLNEEISVNITNRICEAEKNLNYYSVLRSIIDENKYINLEMLSLQLQNTNSKKILIAGFYGADNLGDEIMLQTLLSYFPKETLSSITVMLCDNESYSYYHLPGVNFIHMPKNKFDCNIMAQYFDVLIFGGGALIDDCDFDSENITLNNIFILLSRRFIAFEKKIFALGLSTNKNLSNPNYIEDLRFICENSVYFSLRDIYSKKLLENLGITNTVFLDDLVFFNEIWKKPLPEKNIDKTAVIGIIWVCYEGFEEKLKSIINAVRKKFKKDYIIKLIPFYNCISTDIVFYQKIIEELEVKNDIIVASYHNNLESIVYEMANTDYIINMRYHSMLISNILKIKSLNICYDTHRHYANKVRYLTENFGINENVQLYSELSSNVEDIKLEFNTPVESNGFKLPNPSVLEEIIKDAIQ